MARYVDGFVFSVPKKNKAAYLKMARDGAKAWKKFGALEYMECRADDMKTQGKMTPFPKLLKAKPNEDVWFSFIVFKSRAHRDAVNKKVMAYFGEKYAAMKDFEMPFKENRMSYGGFKAEIEA